MTSARCPACGAAVASGAPWCTLCYADLRDKPAPAPAVSAPSTQSQPSGGGRHRHAPRHAASASAATPAPASAGGIAADLLDPALDRPVMTHADAVQTLAAALPSAAPSAPVTVPGANASWPCFTCGATVPMADETCSQCGSGFLSGTDAGIDLKLPGVGDVRAMSAGKRVALMGGGAVGIMLVLLVVLTVLGHFV